MERYSITTLASFL
ncbi:hypothetical protein Nmel_000090 [Mimus melanotis]